MRNECEAPPIEVEPSQYDDYEAQMYTRCLKLFDRYVDENGNLKRPIRDISVKQLGLVDD